MTAVQRSTDRTEQRSRLSALRERLDLDVIALTSYQGVSYFAGTTIITQNSLPDRLEFFFQFADASPALLLCNIETGMAREQTDITDISEYTEFVDVPAVAAAKLLQERGIGTGRIGIEAKRLPTEAHRDLRDKLPRAEFVPIDDELERLQSVKTESEIDMLRFAAEKTLEAVLGAAATAKPGDGELSVCAEMTTRMMAAGGIYNFMVFGTGRRAMGAHVEATNRPLQEGEIWRVDLGARFFDSINSDLARVGVVGAPTSRQEEVTTALRAIQQAGYDAMEPGRPAREVFNAVKTEFERQRLPFFMPHVGHGLGIGLHEAPILEPANETPLQAGMVLNVEPMVILSDEGECYHMEDLALVTDDGYELLTPPQEALIRIGGD
jgi:Xaa-Pro aminopeptidase